jgi:RNA polymerase sigma-70 factor (ECF subfamily)
VILLVDVHGYDYSEAAELLHVPLGTVKSRLSRARAALRDRLVERGVVRRPAH